jgi:hypothetical protein
LRDLAFEPAPGRRWPAAAVNAYSHRGHLSLQHTRISGFGIGIKAEQFDDVGIADSTIENNRSGAFLDYVGHATIDRTTITGGRMGLRARGTKLGIDRSAIEDNGPWGGIIADYGANLDVNRTTIADNRSFQGGGVRLYYAAARITNSTISGNAANGGGETPALGGGIFAGKGWDLAIRASTITGNVANRGGGIYLSDAVADGGHASIESSILAGNTSNGPECDSNAPAPPAVASLGGNVFGPTGCGTTVPDDLLVEDPGLGQLDDNGGPTRTHALLPGSPAIGHGHPLGLKTDQRGVRRDTDPDSGAYEAENR